jgi:hypothetical protein
MLYVFVYFWFQMVFVLLRGCAPKTEKTVFPLVEPVNVIWSVQLCL